MRVYRRKRNRGGKVRQDRYYTGEHRFEGDERSGSFALKCTHKDVAERKLRELVEREEKRRAGLALPEEQVAAANRPLLDHLRAFIADHKARGQHFQHVQHLENRNERLFRECGWQYLRDVSADSFMRWRASVSNMGAKTKNEYLSAANGLLKWMVATGRASVNPLVNVQRVAKGGEATFERRELTEAEFERLLQVSERRAVLYLAAVLTGFRRGALYGLMWQHVHLEDEDGHIVLPPQLAKNRTGQIHFLRDDLANALAAIRREGVKATERVFAGLLPRVGLDFLKRDLEAAGIAFEDEAGRRFDFHAFRHTSATWGGRSGVSLAELRGHLNHKSPNQTERYMHRSATDGRAVVERFPRFDGTAIGTVGNVRKGPSVSQAVTHQSPDGVTKSGLTASESHSAQEKTALTAVGGEYPLGESNPCFRTENPTSWATRRRGLGRLRIVDDSAAASKGDRCLVVAIIGGRRGRTEAGQ